MMTEFDGKDSRDRKLQEVNHFPETESVYANRKYGYNIKSQLLKLLVIFPAASALAAWICSLI